MIIPDSVVARMLVFLSKWKKNDEAGALLREVEALIDADAQAKMMANRARSEDRP